MLITFSLNFQDPWFLSDFIFESKLLPDVTLPRPTLRPEDMVGGLPGSYRPQVSLLHHDDIIIVTVICIRLVFHRVLIKSHTKLQRLLADL